MAGRKIFVRDESRHGAMYNIIVAKNQKVIQIHRVKSSINFAANYKAMKELTANGYVLYMFLLMHENHRVWALSSKDVYNKTPLTEKTYPKAVIELIKKNYLTVGIIDIGGQEKQYKEEAYHLWEDTAMKAIWEEEHPELVLSEIEIKRWQDAHPEIFPQKDKKDDKSEADSTKKTRKRKNASDTVAS